MAAELSRDVLSGAYRGDLVPGTTQQDGRYGMIEIKAWTGDMRVTPAPLAASQAGQAVYVADVEFQSPTSSITRCPFRLCRIRPWSWPRRLPLPEPSTFLLSVAGLVGLATYACEGGVNDTRLIPFRCDRDLDASKGRSATT